MTLILIALRKAENVKNVVFRNAFSVKIRLFRPNLRYTFVSTKRN